MKKLLFITICLILMSTPAIAEKLFIVNPASNTGNTFKMSNAFKKDLLFKCDPIKRFPNLLIFFH